MVIVMGETYTKLIHSADEQWNRMYLYQGVSLADNVLAPEERSLIYCPTCGAEKYKGGECSYCGGRL